MGRDRVRHVVEKDGRYFWQPSKTLQTLGYSGEPLGADPVKASQRASYLNSEADKDRAAGRQRTGDMLPASAVSRLIPLYLASTAFTDCKPRTQKDYRYVLDQIERKWGKFEVEAFDKEIIGAWLREVSREPKGAYRAYHLGLMLRTFLKWCAPKYLRECPAFTVTTPKSRRVMWTEEEIWKAVGQIESAGFQSLAVGLLIEWCIGQNPGDVWNLKRSAYKNGAIDVVRAKTGVGGQPIPLWADIRERLDGYLESMPALPDAPLLRNERTGGVWVESTRAKIFAAQRGLAGLRSELQLRDLRRTAITEALEAGATRDQTRGLSRHLTAQGMEPYIVMNDSTVAQALRDSARTHSNKRPIR